MRKHARYKRFQPLFPVISIAVVALSLLFFSRCAQIVAPSGGPKDTIPPVLARAIPADSSLHFNSKKILLDFDEFVQLQNLNDQLIISPNPKRQPVITAKLKSITIELKDTLEPNTTYTFNMGNAVQDIDEGNPINDFRYVFSTGSYLDSLELSGSLQYAATGLPDSNIVVMLYKHLEDSVVSKEKPLYYTKTNGKGKFIFRNLPHGTFKLFALKDASSDLQYNDSTEFIAFRDSAVALNKTDTGFNLLLFREKEARPGKDTSAHPVAATQAEKGKEKEKKLTFSPSQQNGLQDLTLPLQLQFGSPLKTFDSSKISLQEDTTFIPVHPINTLDSTGKTLSLTYKWKEDMPYRLLLQPGFATDTGGVTVTKADTINFRTKKLADYGAMILHFTDYDSTQHYLVQLVQNEEIKYAAPLTGIQWRKEMLVPGDYQVRILIDANNNGKWDTGCYYCHPKRQPEKVIALPQKFTIRSNWDNDFSGLAF